MASTTSDHTVNKIALYSALFAGVAYVGYSYVKDSMSKSKRRQNKGESKIIEKFVKTPQVFIIFGADFVDPGIVSKVFCHGSRK